MSVKVLNWILKIFFLLCLSVLFCGVPQEASAFWFSGGEPLLKINDVAYTSSDFRVWWREWREPGSKLPKDMTPFVEWMLLVQEAREMELEDNREYRRKVDIFLKSRSLIMLKQEEVVSRLKEPEKEVLWLEYEKKYQAYSHNSQKDCNHYQFFGIPFQIRFFVPEKPNYSGKGQDRQKVG